MPYPHRAAAAESPSARWAAAASVSDSRRADIRSLFQKDRGVPTNFPAQRTHGLGHVGSADARRAWNVQPTKKFDDTDEEAQSPMVTSHNGTTRVFSGIPPVMTSSLCSTVGDEQFTGTSVNGKFVDFNVF